MRCRPLKPGWRMVKFGDVVHNANLTVRNLEKTELNCVVGLEHIEPENLHIRRWDDIADGTSFTRRFVPGQTLFGKRRAYQKKVAYAEFEGVCSGDILTFESKDHKALLPELLPFIVQSDGFFEYALGTSAGSLSPRTSWTALQSYECPLPPIEEQHRIAEILWAADKTIWRYFHSLECVKQLKMACLDELSNTRYPKQELEDVLVYASDGPFGSKLKTEHYVDDGAIVVRLQNINPLWYDNSNKAFISFSYYNELKRYSLQSGDILVAGLGDDAHPVGRACMVPETLGPAINKADCFCLRPDRDRVLPDYLCYFLNSAFARKELMRITQGTTRFRINTSNLRTITILLPDLNQQKVLVKQLRQVEESENHIVSHINQARLAAKMLLEKILIRSSVNV